MYRSREYFVWDDQDRIRVQVVRAEGTPLAPGVVAADPAIARPHAGKMGWCEQEAKPDPVNYPDYTNPRITLDDGAVLWGYQCWWQPVLTPAGEAWRERLVSEMGAADSVPTEGLQ